MLVKFSCDCIGFFQGDNVYLIKACDRSHNDNELCLHPSKRLLEKTSSPLPQEEEVKLLAEIGSLINDGYRFRTIKQLIQE